MNAKAGMTLVEVLAAGALAAILAGTILATMNMNNVQITEGNARYRIGLYSSAISDQLRRFARGSATVLTDRKSVV